MLFLGKASRRYVPGMRGMKSMWPAEIIIKVHLFWKKACLEAHSTLPEFSLLSARGAEGKEQNRTQYNKSKALFPRSGYLTAILDSTDRS